MGQRLRNAAPPIDASRVLRKRRACILLARRCTTLLSIACADKSDRSTAILRARGLLWNATIKHAIADRCSHCVRVAAAIERGAT